MQALKTLVAGLGLLIVVGSGVLIWGLYQKATDPDFKMFSFGAGAPDPAAPPRPSAPAAAPSGAADRPFADVDLGLPATCEIADMQVAAGRLFLRIGGGPACERIVAVDAADGRVLGTITARR